MAETLLDRKLGTSSLVVKLAGQPIDLDELGQVAIRHGRTKPDGQPDASTVTLVTNAARQPEVGQDLTVELGASALAILGLPLPAANYMPNPRGVLGANWFSDWAGGGGVATLAGRTGQTGWAGGTTTSARQTWTVASSPGAGGSLYTLVDVEPKPYARDVAIRYQVRTSVAMTGYTISTAYLQDYTNIGDVVSGTFAVPANTVVTREFTRQVPANTAHVSVFFANRNDGIAWAVAAWMEATRVQIEMDRTVAGPYFDGDTPDTTQVTYSWEATAHNSKSILEVPLARRFTGKVTRSQLTPEPGAKTARRRVQVTAASPLARLGRQYVGDAPWPAEQDGARIARLLALASGVTAGPVDSGTVSILARDVDRQPLLKLAQEVADDADGILVQLRDGRVAYHDGDHRQLVAVALELDATEVLWPVVWTQDLEGMVNDLTVTYGAADPQAEYREVDDAAVATHGLYAAKVATQLADAAAAEAYALLTTARRGRPWWDLSTVTVELVRSLGGGLHPQALLLLGLEVSDLARIVGWPTSGPQQLGRLWVEGWTETITSSSWQLVLAVTPYGRTGPAARWVDVLSTVTWATFPPLTWAQLASWDPGTSPSGAWYGAPSNLTWADAPATTWATWPY